MSGMAADDAGDDMADEQSPTRAARQIAVVIVHGVGEATPGYAINELVDTTGGDETASFSTRSPRRRLDAVFVGRAARRWESEVWRKRPVSFASDHFPVVARIWLSSETPRPELPNPDRSAPPDPGSAAD